jgi:multidrug efflux pump subunit AcrA (membrane-fusion protein)
MKPKFLLPVILALVLAACGSSGNTPAALPTVMLGNQAVTPYPATNSGGGGVTASGVVVADLQAEMAFSLPGNVRLVNVKVGDQVQTGQTLIQLEDAAQQIALEQANLALQELTSPEAIANARLVVTSAQTDVINAQYGVNNQLYWKNTGLIQDQYSNVVIAKEILDKAQTAYDNANVGEYINNANEAAAYQSLYNAQEAYKKAEYYFSLYSQKPTQRQLDESQATLDMANAQLTNAQNYLAVLTGGKIPDGASGPALQAYRQAQFAIQTAQNALDATRLVAPFPGQVASLRVSLGDYVLPGQVILVLCDVKHMHVETTDLSERDVPSVTPGQVVTVTIKALNQDVTGKVMVISPLADSLGGDVVYMVTIALDEIPATLRDGMSVDVLFNTSQ